MIRSIALSFFLIASAFAAEAPADLIVVNGTILTVDANNRKASAVAIRDGKFAAVGSDPDVQEAHRRAWNSADVVEGMAAFRERRPAAFTGR